MKKVLQLNISNSGSTGRISEEIGQVWSDSGFESFIAYGRIKSKSTSKIIQVGSIWDHLMHGFITRAFDRHGFGSYLATKKLITQIKKINPDVILLHNLHGYYVNIEVLFDYLKTLDIPIIWTLFDCWAFTGHCTYFDKADCQKWVAQCFECPLISEYPSSWGVDRSKINYDKKKEIFNNVNNMSLVAHSNWLGDLVRRSFLKNYTVYQIANGVNLDVFKPISTRGALKKYNLPDNYILGVANIWNKRKGLSDFLRLSKLIKGDLKIVLVGLESNKILDMPPNIIGVRHTESTSELAEIYSHAVAFINPTAEDNFPTVNIEAVACGTPVITYNTGGSPEAINENTGFVVAKGDVQGIATAIEKIQASGKEYFLKQCRQRALDNFDYKARYREYIDLYNFMVSEKQATKND